MCLQGMKGDSPWAEEFQAAVAAAGPATAARSSGDTLQQTRALADTLAASSDPKFQRSQFLQFVSKMSRGEIILEDNQVPFSQPQSSAWVTKVR